MRLTLRTLLAWLDDTLPPAEVREIGKQVSESEFAKELVDRIHRVTRQRRLTVPASKGPDATDPNLVASYLDNELQPEQVAAYEKLCLTSDVHLAEVASCHQILSLIGQKAKVPDEAKRRMYLLIKGRETVVPRASAQTSAPAPVSEPVQPWITPEPPRRPWLERFGPAAAVVALIVVLCVSAWQSLKPSATSPPMGPVAGKAVNPSDQGAAEKPSPPLAPVEKAQVKREAEPTATTTTPSVAAVRPGVTSPTEPGATAKAEPKPEALPGASPTAAPEARAPAPTELPPGVAGIAEQPSGVLLRYHGELGQWEQVTAEAPLKGQDRLLSLNPFRATINFGGAKVDLVGETEVMVLARAPAQAAHFNLAHGRVVLHGIAPAAPFLVECAGRRVEITPPAGVPIGLEEVYHRESGFTAPTAASDLIVYAPEGEVTLVAGAARETLAGPGAIALRDGAWTEERAKPAPSWVTEDKPPPHDQAIGALFAKYFRPDRPAIANLIEAVEDADRDVSRLAIQALRAAGDISMIVPLLSTPDQPAKRRTAIGVLRDSLAQSPETLKGLREQLQSNYGPDLASKVEKLLIGYTPKEAREDATYDELVSLLSSEDVGVRELALDNLRALTGRDELGYDPDKPNEGKGLKAWQDLLHQHELRPVAARKAES